MSKAKKRVFSVVKAVKQNARDRVGPVPPGARHPRPKAEGRRQAEAQEDPGRFAERGRR